MIIQLLLRGGSTQTIVVKAAGCPKALLRGFPYRKGSFSGGQNRITVIVAGGSLFGFPYSWKLSFRVCSDTVTELSFVRLGFVPLGLGPETMEYGP